MKPSFNNHSTQALLFALTAASCLGSITGQAAEPAQLMIDAGPCIRLDNASQRYACYEQQVETALNASLDNASTARPPAPVVSVPAAASHTEAQAEEDAAVETAATDSSTFSTSSTSSTPEALSSRASNEDTFGLPEPESEKQQAVEELRGVISKLEETLPNQYLITLENGQVWRQTRPEPRFRMKAGHNVRIYPTSWGNDYRLSVDELRGYIQVERIQ